MVSTWSLLYYHIEIQNKFQVQIVQSFANSINKLIETEKLLEAGGNLDEVLYG